MTRGGGTRTLGITCSASIGWQGGTGRSCPGRVIWNGTTSSDFSKVQVLEETRYSLDFLNDLAVVVLFSVFEQLIRGQVHEEVLAEAKELRHPLLRKAGEDTLWAVERGSLARLLEPYKTEGWADLIEEVNQVRDYRNWVAHGRRGKLPPSVTPNAAFERLSRFLKQILPDELPRGEIS